MKATNFKDMERIVAAESAETINEHYMYFFTRSRVWCNGFFDAKIINGKFNESFHQGRTLLRVEMELTVDGRLTGFFPFWGKERSVLLEVESGYPTPAPTPYTLSSTYTGNHTQNLRNELSNRSALVAKSSASIREINQSIEYCPTATHFSLVKKYFSYLANDPFLSALATKSLLKFSDWAVPSTGFCTILSRAGL